MADKPTKAEILEMARQRCHVRVGRNTLPLAAAERLRDRSVLHAAHTTGYRPDAANAANAHHCERAARLARDIARALALAIEEVRRELDNAATIQTDVRPPGATSRPGAVLRVSKGDRKRSRKGRRALRTRS